MTAFSAADEPDAAKRLAAQQQAIAEKLINLEDHLGRRFLDSAALAGVTQQRRAEVLEDFATLWAHYESYRTALVTGATTVALPARDGALLGRQVTLAELVAEIEVVYGRTHEILTAVNRVWTELTPRIDSCDTLLRQAQALVADLGLAADQDPAAAAFSRLADLRRIILTDPLRLWACDAVARAGVDQLVAQCERIRADLQELAELRRHAGQRLDQVADTLAEVRRLHRETSEERHRVSTKIRPASEHPGPATTTETPSADLSGSRLTTAGELCRHGDWRRLATELPALKRDTDTALQQAKAELIEAGRPLRERAELRGRLGAYRAKAAGLGRIEDLALEQRYLRARTLLWRAPCDLAVAAAAVAEYQDAVNATGTNGGPA